MMQLARLKHWQIFLLMFGLEVVKKMLTSFQLITWSSYLKSMPIAVWFSLLIIFLWLMSIDRALESNGGKQGVFRIICSASILLQLYLAITQSSYGQIESSLLTMLRLINFGVLVYACLRVGRLIKTRELDRSVKLNEFFSTSLLLLISPIGVWFVQPRLIKILEGK
jgi:hypothetical protein